MKAWRVALALALAACRKTDVPASPDASAVAMGVASSAANEDRPVDAASVVAARCTFSLGAGEVPSTAPTDIGEAVSTPTQIAVGLTHTLPTGKNGAIALVATASPLAAPLLVDLGPAYGDAPPPRPIARGEELYAVAYGRTTTTGTTATRDLIVSKIVAGKAVPVATLPRKLNESLAFDAALGEKGGLLAWDEDVAPVRGVIRVAVFSADKPASRIASPETSDAESPRIAARPGGYWLVWIARTPEPVRDGGGHELEGPGEDRTYAWLELVALDEAGAPARAVQRVTPAKGHVGAFDLAARNGGADLDILARDDEEARDGAGGRLVVHSVHDQTIATQLVVPEGVGRGIPDLLPPWLVFFDATDHIRLLSFAAAAIPMAGAMKAAPASAEPALEGARPLAVTPAGLLAAFPADPKHLFRLLACSL